MRKHLVEKHGKRQKNGFLIQPHDINWTADSGAQVTVLGDKHIEYIGLDISSLYPSSMSLGCANYTKSNCLGVFFGRIRGKCPRTGREMIHKGMVYVIPGDITLISDKALQDLGILPKEFPVIGQFGGKMNTVSNLVTIQDYDGPSKGRLKERPRDKLVEVGVELM